MYEVNRSVFIVIPNEPFWYWLNSLPDSDLSNIIESRVEEIFAAELGDWCEDESLWPDLHPDIFREWFDIELSSIVTDLSSEPLQREAFGAIEFD